MMGEVLARIETHDWIIDALSREPRRTLLDVPAGTGALAQRIKVLGFSVFCCDINLSLFSASGIEISRGDLNQALPYPTGMFDLVTCIEGLEHLENPFNETRKFHRILNPGGKLIISLPNYLKIERRLRFLVTGLFSKIPTPRRLGKERFENLWMLRLIPLTYPILKLVLEHEGFKILSFDKDKEKKRMRWLLPRVWGIRFYCFF